MNASGIWTFNTRKDENDTDTTETKNRQGNQWINQVRKRTANYDRAKAIKGGQSDAHHASKQDETAMDAETRLCLSQEASQGNET